MLTVLRWLDEHHLLGAWIALFPETKIYNPSVNKTVFPRFSELLRPLFEICIYRTLYTKICEVRVSKAGEDCKVKEHPLR